MLREDRIVAIELGVEGGETGVESGLVCLQALAPASCILINQTRKAKGGDGHARLAAGLKHGGARVGLKVAELDGRRLLEERVLPWVRRDQLAVGVLRRDVPAYCARLI